MDCARETESEFKSFMDDMKKQLQDDKMEELLEEFGLFNIQDAVPEEMAESELIVCYDKLNGEFISEQKEEEVKLCYILFWGCLFFYSFAE
eukprot:Nk52_evm4s361 gene=Nk52_evmTU4s361